MKKSSGPKVPDVERLRRKAVRLMERMETQVWLLADPDEALQLAHGVVPTDIVSQAEDALDAVHGRHFRSADSPLTTSSTNGSSRKLRGRRGSMNKESPNTE